jgi:hypothetical protein
MPELVVILCDFPGLPPEAPRAEWSRLPLLERVLARAQVSVLPGDWRGWLAATAAPAELSQFSPAAIAHAAFRQSALRAQRSGYWLATPVYFFAGLDTLRIHPLGLLRLSEQEQLALVADFARLYSDSPWRLEPLGQRELLLSGLQADADGADPALFAGVDPSDGLPRGASAGTLRRLGSEVEMWLHEHPLNAARLARGEAPVSALWFWGARPPAVPAACRKLDHARLYGSDTYAEALWRLQQRGGSESLSAALTAISTVPIQLDSDSVVLYSTASETGLMDSLITLEQCWFGSALRALRQRRLATLRLIAGSRLYSVTALSLARIWCSRRPWWETLA